MRGLALIPLALLALPAPAAAESPIADIVCAPSDEMRTRLTREYGATLTGTGLRDQDSVMELWSSAGGDWTLVVAYATGLRCIVAMGEAWDSIAPPDPA
jgi:predicted methyltransferase